MKRLLKIVSTLTLMLILVACANFEGGNQNNTGVPGGTNTEEENAGDIGQSTEEENENDESDKTGETDDSTEDDNQGETYWITGTTVNFRKSPAMDGEIIAQLAKGTEVIKISEEGEWLYIRYGEINGYVHGDYASANPPSGANDGEDEEQDAEITYVPEEVVYNILNPELIPTKAPAQGTAEEILNGWETMPVGAVLSSEQLDRENLSSYFVEYEISDAVFNIINGRSYRENPDVQLEDLRYLKVLHYNFEHEIQVGELIVSRELATDFICIFYELFCEEYEIQSMYLVDYYWTGDPTDTDSASIEYNNTSAFMYRPATSSSDLSKHAYGRAIDINPQQNPYVSYSSGSPVWSHRNASDYIDRTTGLPHMITEEDTCYKIFTKYGFSWGGSWKNPKDYQHFYK